MNDMVVSPISEVNHGDSTGNSSPPTSPTTVTVIEILSNVSTSSSSTPSHLTTFQSSLPSIPLTTTTTVTTSEIISSSSRISSSTPTPPPTSTSSLAPSVSRSSSTSSHPNSSEAQLSQNFSASSLNLGAIAGILLACLFTFFIGAFFAIRIWSKKKRALKQRKMWSRSMFSKPYAIDAPGGSSYEAKLASVNRSSQGPPHSVKTPSPHLSVPPISYNNDAVFQYSTTSGTSSPSVFTSPVYSPGLMSLSPYSTTVLCTFIPSLPDELTISVGETLRVLAGYEDGWSLCKNGQGKQGMVPNECLEKSLSSMGLLPPNGDYISRVSRSSARVSSLAQAVRGGR